jgi:hypothetical protein
MNAFREKMATEQAQAVGGGFSMLTTRHAAFRSIVPLRQSLSVRAAGRNSDSGR